MGSKKIKAIKDQANTDEAKAAEKLISALAKAETNRDAVTKAKVNKAAHESEKVEAAKDKANTAEAKAAKAKAEARAATVNIITVDVGKSSKRKKASKGLIKRLSKEIAAPTQEQLEIEKSKADKLKNAITQAKVAKAHAESKKIEVAKEKVAKAQELKRNAILAKHARKTGSRS